MNQQQKNIQQLALEAKSHPRGSTERQKALTQSIGYIKKSGILARNRDNYPPDIYSDALSETILDICRNIDLYDSAKSDFATWIAQILESHLQEIINGSTK